MIGVYNVIMLVRAIFFSIALIDPLVGYILGAGPPAMVLPRGAGHRRLVAPGYRRLVAVLSCPQGAMCGFYYVIVLSANVVIPGRALPMPIRQVIMICVCYVIMLVQASIFFSIALFDPVVGYIFGAGFPAMVFPSWCRTSSIGRSWFAADSSLLFPASWGPCAVFSSSICPHARGLHCAPSANSSGRSSTCWFGPSFNIGCRLANSCLSA